MLQSIEQKIIQENVIDNTHTDNCNMISENGNYCNLCSLSIFANNELFKNLRLKFKEIEVVNHIYNNHKNNGEWIYDRTIKIKKNRKTNRFTYTYKQYYVMY